MSTFRSPKLRLILLAAALVAAVSVPLLWNTAEAVVIGGPHICVYYSDATYSTAVGARGEGCCGAPISWGVTSKYVQCEQLYCLQVICPQ